MFKEQFLMFSAIKKSISAVFALFLLFPAVAEKPTATVKPVKYVFLFIGDGMSLPQRMLAEEYSVKIGNGKLAINSMPYQALTTTSSGNRLITDSAASGTAIACGEKTVNGCLGMDVERKRNLTSIAQTARDAGRKVGIVTTVTLNHATPGAFYAHNPSRGNYYQIALDLLKSGFDYFGGCEIAKYNDTKDKKYCGNIYDLAGKYNYKVARGRQEITALQTGSGKIIAVAPGAYAIDRQSHNVSLTEFVRQAITMLDNEKGFFLMAEGGMIDWGGHANDAATTLKEVLDFDRAVKAAIEFAGKHPNETLIVVTGDHETGGMTMGFAGSGNYMNLKLFDDHTASIADFQNQLKKMRKNNPGLQFDDVKPLMSKCFGFKFKNYTSDDKQGISVKELTALKKAFAAKRLSREVSNVINRKAGIGWASGSHTALPVLTTSIGCKSEKFSGFIENTDIANTLKSLL